MNNSLRLLFSISLFLSILNLSAQNLHQLVKEGNANTVAEYIMEFPEQINSLDQFNRTPLMEAMSTKNKDLIKILLNHKADINKTDKWGNRAIHFAASNNFLTGTELLIEYGADINAQNQWKISPLHFAINSGFKDMVYLLLNKGANPDLNSSWGTPIQVAIKRENKPILSMLLQNGADPNKTNEVGNNAMHVAVYTNNCDIINILLKNNTKPSVTNKLGYQPVHIAAICGYKKLIELFDIHNINIKTKDENGNNLLDLSICYHHPELEKFLLKKGLKTTEKYRNHSNLTLNKPLYEEANIFYMGHSGWVIETLTKYLIFDYHAYIDSPAKPSLYNGNVSLDELTDKPKYIFVTHSHRDHYDTTILEWQKQTDNIHYIFGWKANTDSNHFYFEKPYLKKKINDITVQNIKCEDGGSAFLIFSDGLSIYHSGDYTGNMKKDINYLSSQQAKIDMAFIGLSDTKVANYTLEKLNPFWAFPMHKRFKEYKYLDYKSEFADKYCSTEIITAKNKGDHFRYVK